MAKKKIPGGVMPRDFLEISSHLERILNELRDEVRGDPALKGTCEDHMPKEVHMRLNVSDTDQSLSVFVGWVEDEELKRRRIAKNEPDPGLYRFGDTAGSLIYECCVRTHKADHFEERDWRSQLQEKRPEEKALAAKAGLMYQRAYGIMIADGSDCHCVGTLNVGFFQKPPDRVLEKVHHKMREWAQQPGKPLLAILKADYELGGPTFRMQ
jgi:hypothetical protein